MRDARPLCQRSSLGGRPSQLVGAAPTLQPCPVAQPTANNSMAACRASSLGRTTTRCDKAVATSHAPPYNPPTYRSAAWLAQHLHDPKIIDARSAKDYAEGHIPGAVLLPNDTFRSTRGVPDACTPEEFAATAGMLGVHSTDTVVCYDGTGGARTWWVFARFGHRDVRSAGEYAGADPRSNSPARAGHIPRAVNLEWTELVDPSTGLFKPVDEMRRLLDAKGITPDKEIVSYCQGGGRAAHGVLTLKLLGYRRVRNFDGSYGAYAASTAPVER